MKKRFRITALCLAILITGLLWFEMPAHAACPAHSMDDTPLDYRVIGGHEGDVVAYAKYRHCGEWFPFCGSDPQSMHEHE